MPITKKDDKLPPDHKTNISLGQARAQATKRNKAKGVTLPKLPPFKEDDEDARK
jgi:hypothetical protein